MIEITHFTKFNGFLTKRISLTETGAMKSDGSECVMSKGTARRLVLPDHHALAAHIHNLKPIEAIALGALVSTVTAHKSRIVTKAAFQQLNGHAAAEGVITRTSDFIQYRDGQQAFALIDVDTKGMPQSVRARVIQAGGFWPAIVSVAPKLTNAARVVRNSTSSCISRSDTGESMPGSEGQHIYVMVTDGADVERFLRVLHARLYSKPRAGWDIPSSGGPTSPIVMARLVRAIYSSTYAATDGPDKPGHDDEDAPPARLNPPAVCCSWRAWAGTSSGKAVNCWSAHLST